MSAADGYTRIASPFGHVFVLATARSQKRFSGVARNRGATRYVEKRFTVTEFMACIGSIGGSRAVA